MPRQREFQTNFSSGQLSARLAAQKDAGIYRNGAREVLNGQLMKQGGVARRAGTCRRVTLFGEARIEGMIYSRSEAYIAAFSDGRLDIYTPDGVVEQSFTDMPWSGEVKWFLTFDRLGNLTWITDQSFRTRVLTRTGPGTFTMTTLAFDERDGESFEPRHKFLRDDATLTPSGTSGSVTLTCSEALFVAGYVGAKFTIRNATATITAVTNSTTATATLNRELSKSCDPFPFSVVQGSKRVTVVLADHELKSGNSFTISEASETGGLTMNGTWTVSRVLDRDRFTFTHSSNATSSEDGGGPAVTIAAAVATRDWKEPAFSVVRGWPQSVVFHDARAWLAGSPSIGDAMFASRTQALFDFDPGTGQADEAIVAIGQTQTNSILHMHSSDDLLVFGDAAEAYLPSSDEPLSQANVRGRKQTEIGATYSRPQPYDGAILFADVMGSDIHEFVYIEENAAYVTTPISGLCPEIITGPVNSCGFKGGVDYKTPAAIWAMQDGTAAVFVSRRSEGSAGWAPWTTNGGFVSFTALNERLYVCARRVVDGEDEYWLEEFDFGLDGTKCRGDAGSYLTSETPITTWGGIPIGPNRIVDVVDTDTGNYIGRYITSANGLLVLEMPLRNILVSLPFTFRLETLPPAIQSQEGEMMGEVMRIGKVITRFYKTTFAKVDGEIVTARRADDILGPLVPISEPVETTQVGWRPEPTVVIESDLPEPCVVLGINWEVVY